ncbi:MAG: TlpA family protein disulfide reductase [Bacteroidia bacterium]
MRIFSTLFLFIFAQFPLRAQNVTIRGAAPTHEGKEIALYVYNDLITYTQTREVFDTVDSKGGFELKLDVFHQQAVVLKIGNLTGKLYLEPYYQYAIIFPPADTERFANPNNEQSVDITIMGDSTELNARIIDFNTQFDNFWAKNYKAFVAQRLHQQLDSFQLYCNKRYAKVKNKYFKTYVEYSFASVNENTGRHHNYIAKAYLLNKPVHYTNYEYMEFFNQFFKQYLKSKESSKLGNNILDIVNEEGSYQSLNAILKDDPLLKSDSIRELVILKSMFEFYYYPKYNKEKVSAIISQLMEQTKNEEHKKIAANMLRIFQKLQPGALAPDFRLKDAKGREFSLSDFRGKFVYLEFFASWSTGSLQEMKKLEQIEKKYGDKIVFISVSVDDSLKDFTDFTKKNPKYDWLLLHYGNDKSLKEQYDIKTVPAYFFINREGYFIQSPAQKPSEGLVVKFQQILKAQTKPCWRLRSI